MSHVPSDVIRFPGNAPPPQPAGTRPGTRVPFTPAEMRIVAIRSSAISGDVANAVPLDRGLPTFLRVLEYFEGLAAAPPAGPAPTQSGRDF